MKIAQCPICEEIFDTIYITRQHLLVHPITVDWLVNPGKYEPIVKEEIDI
jgi:hypothetical protein